MPRHVKVAAARMGPDNEGARREGIVERMRGPGDELVAPRIDLDRMLPVRKRWNFPGRRPPRHDGPLLQPVPEKEPYR